MAATKQSMNEKLKEFARTQRSDFAVTLFVENESNWHSFKELLSSPNFNPNPTTFIEDIIETAKNHADRELSTVLKEDPLGKQINAKLHQCIQDQQVKLKPEPVTTAFLWCKVIITLKDEKFVSDISARKELIPQTHTRGLTGMPVYDEKELIKLTRFMMDTIGVVNTQPKFRP